MNNFMKAIDTLTTVINGSENRKGADRRKNKQRKRKMKGVFLKGESSCEDI